MSRSSSEIVTAIDAVLSSSNSNDAKVALIRDALKVPFRETVEKFSAVDAPLAKKFLGILDEFDAIKADQNRGMAVMGWVMGLLNRLAR